MKAHFGWQTPGQAGAAPQEVSGLLMGIVLLQVSQSRLNILSFSPFFKKFTWGLALLVVMVLNYLVARRASIHTSKGALT